MLIRKSKFMHHGLSFLIIALMVSFAAGCTAPRHKTGMRGIGKPPPEQAPIVYRQKNPAPLITPEADPFAAH